MKPSALWRSILSQLEQELGENDIATWLRPIATNPEHVNGILVLITPNRYFRNKIQSDYLERISELACALSGDRVQVKLQDCAAKTGTVPTTDSTDRGRGTTPPPQNTKRRKRLFGFGELNPDFTFQQHIVGETNRLARVAAEKVSKDPGFRDYNPLFLYGQVGIGKTHLMHAAGHAMTQNNPNAKIGYVQASSFVQHLVKLIVRRDNETIDQFKSAYRELDALLIDDIHLFAGAEASQEEFLHTFNTLLEGQKQIVITSDRFFKELTPFKDRLISRFGAGLTIRIKPPELETRIAILETKAILRGLELKPEVSRFLAENISNSVRELEGALNRLTASHKLLGQDISINLIKQTLSDLLEYSNKPLTTEEIQREVARFFSIRLSDMRSKNRQANIARARQVAMCLARELTNTSLPDIGNAFGGRNHATVMHAVKVVNTLREKNTRFKNDYQTLYDLLCPNSVR